MGLVRSWNWICFISHMNMSLVGLIIPGSRDCIDPRIGDFRDFGIPIYSHTEILFKNVGNVMWKQVNEFAFFNRVTLCAFFPYAVQILVKTSSILQVWLYLNSFHTVPDLEFELIRASAPVPPHLAKQVTLREDIQCLLWCARPSSRRRSVVLYSLPENLENLSRKPMGERKTTIGGCWSFSETDVTCA